jgi:hypothetical protein
MRAVLAAAAVLVVALGVAAFAGDLGRRVSAPPAGGPGTVLTVGTLAAPITHQHEVTPDRHSPLITRVVLVVLPSGAGSVRLPDVPEPVPVRFVAAGVDRVRLLARGSSCPDPQVLDLSVHRDGDAFGVTAARAGPCFAPDRLGPELVGAVFRPTP